MSLNPGQATKNHAWNYSNAQREGYSPLLVGTVVCLQEVQKRSFNPNGPGVPEFWPDGNPKMNIRIGVATPEGELKTLTFQPASKAAREGKKKSIHMDLFALTNNTDMMNLMGKTIAIQTEEGTYGLNNPRPWNVGFVEGGPYELAEELPAEYKAAQVLCNDAASGGQMQQPQPVQQPVMQQPQPVVQQPVYPQPYNVQPMVQPANMPQGMNPQVAQAMQQIGAVSVQPMQQAQPVMGRPYDDVPF